MSFTENGRMQIFYNSKSDLLYLRLDDRKQQVINQRISAAIVLDIGEDDKIVGIEISELPSVNSALTIHQR